MKPPPIKKQSDIRDCHIRYPTDQISENTNILLDKLFRFPDPTARQNFIQKLLDILFETNQKLDSLLKEIIGFSQLSKSGGKP